MGLTLDNLQRLICHKTPPTNQSYEEKEKKQNNPKFSTFLHIVGLHSLERAATGIGLHVNAHKTEYMCFNQTGDISTREKTGRQLVDKFTHLGSSVSSTKKDIDMRLRKAWTAIDKLSIIWKSDLTDKMKRSFFQAVVVSILLYGCTTWTLTKRLE